MTTQTFSVQSLLRPEIAGMEEYVPIQPFEVLSQRLGIPAEQIIKLDANENPYGPLPVVAEALAEYPYYHVYPDPQQTELRAALSRFVGVPAEHILPSHGADELLDYLCRLFLQPGDAIINCPPTFGMYSFDAGLAGAQVILDWRSADYSLNIDEIERVAADSPKAKILFLTSPNNPSGNWLPDEELRRLLQLPLLVVLDEAYVEFADHPSRSNWVLAHENLVILRTFSKAAGIAGRTSGVHVPARGVDAVFVEDFPRVDDVAFGFAHLRAVFGQDVAQADDVFEGGTVEEQRAHGVERIEPAAGLVDGLADVVGLLLFFVQFVVLERVVPLRHRH
jgi:histidinol-phosphate aminotransferase